ncbi:hypothetical protein F5887DRAFT_118925 [Amanita rubescens]|nr:hypothetical protein F5887DRAFT_118925 [Amanita rubescens]
MLPLIKYALVAKMIDDSESAEIESLLIPVDDAMESQPEAPSALPTIESKLPPASLPPPLPRLDTKPRTLLPPVFPRIMETQSPAISSPLSVLRPPSSYIRNSRKIREQKGHIYGWFESEGTSSLDMPPLLREAIPNDLFVHRPDSGEIQIWLWSAENLWRPIQVGASHPLLPTHRLIINNGKPRWVTRQTVAAYASRSKHLLSKRGMST